MTGPDERLRDMTAHNNHADSGGLVPSGGERALGTREEIEEN